jgi:hypothetical protein
MADIKILTAAAWAEEDIIFASPRIDAYQLAERDSVLAGFAFDNWSHDLSSLFELKGNPAVMLAARREDGIPYRGKVWKGFDPLFEIGHGHCPVAFVFGRFRDSVKFDHVHIHLVGDKAQAGIVDSDSRCITSALPLLLELQGQGVKELMDF